MSLRDPPDERSPGSLLSFGVINLDKPPGPDAHQVAGWVRDLIGEAQAEHGVPRIDRTAHGGTLDPKVTGCLPMLLGDATRLAQVFADAPKEYVTVLELHGPRPGDFDAIISEFEGELYQKPPRKSAVSRRLRSREVSDLTVLERADRRALLRVRCEAGTYIRKLCHDLGLALGTGAHMGALRRTASGVFDDTDLVTMEEVADALAVWAQHGDPEPLRAVVDPAERALRGLPRVTVADSAARQIAEGAPVYAPGVMDTRPAPSGGDTPERDSLVVCTTSGGSAVCLGTLVGDPDTNSGVVVDLERVLV